MSEQVYGERRRRREAERAEQQAALREIQAAQERAAGAPQTQSRRELRSSRPSTFDVPALEAEVEPRGSRHETASSVSHVLAPVSPIQPVARFTRSAAPADPATPRAPSATPPGSSASGPAPMTPASRPQSPAVSRAPFHPPTDGPGQQGYPTAAIPTIGVPGAQSPAQPPTVARPGSAPGAFGSGPAAGSRGGPSAPGPRSAMPAVKPHGGPWTPGAQPSTEAVPSSQASTTEVAAGGYPFVVPASVTRSPGVVAPDTRSGVGQPQSWGDVIHGSGSAHLVTPTSPVGQPQAPPLSVFATPTTPGSRPTTLAAQFGASMAAGHVTPPPIPTSGIVIPTVLGQSPSLAARSAAAVAPTWSAKVETGPPTGSPVLGGGTFDSTAVRERREAPFADEEQPPHSHAWIQFLVLFLVAFVLGLLIYLLINGGSSAVASGAASAQLAPALFGFGRRRSPGRFAHHRPRHRGEL